MTKSCDALITMEIEPGLIELRPEGEVELPDGGYPETLTVCGVYYAGHRARDVIRCPIEKVEGLRQSSLAVLMVTEMVAAMSAHERLQLLVKVRDAG